MVRKLASAVGARTKCSLGCSFLSCRTRFIRENSFRSAYATLRCVTCVTAALVPANNFQNSDFQLPKALPLKTSGSKIPIFSSRNGARLMPRFSETLVNWCDSINECGFFDLLVNPSLILRIICRCYNTYIRQRSLRSVPAVEQPEGTVTVTKHIISEPPYAKKLQDATVHTSS